MTDNIDHKINMIETGIYIYVSFLLYSNSVGLRTDYIGECQDGGSHSKGPITGIKPITPGFSHAIDLLKNLPDASYRKKIAQAQINAVLAQAEHKATSGQLCPEELLAKRNSDASLIPPETTMEPVTTKGILKNSASSARYCTFDPKVPYSDSLNQGLNYSNSTPGTNSYTTPNSRALHQSTQNFQKSCSDLLEGSESRLPILEACAKSNYCTLPRQVFAVNDSTNIPKAKKDVSSFHHSLDPSAAIEPPVQFASIDRRRNSNYHPSIKTISRNIPDNSKVYLSGIIPDAQATKYAPNYNSGDKDCCKRSQPSTSTADSHTTTKGIHSSPSRREGKNNFSHASEVTDTTKSQATGKHTNYSKGKSSSRDNNSKQELSTFC